MDVSDLRVHLVDVEPGSGGGGVSGWVVAGVVVAGVGLLAIAGFLVSQSLNDDAAPAPPEADATNATQPSITATASTTSTLVTSTTAATSKITEVTTTLQPEASQPDPFVGWWKAVDVDGSLIDLRVDEEGRFFYWDSASGQCDNNGVGSPETWEGTTKVDLSGRPTLTVSGTKQCYFYGAENPPATPRGFDYFYDAATGTLEFAPDGVRYSRSPDVPGHPVDASNPLVGSWEATDGDGTHVNMTIQGDGTWSSTDTRSGGCERKGYTYATWSAQGSGSFTGDRQATFNLMMTTFCNPPDGSQVVHSPEVIWTFVHDQSTDTVVLVESNGTTYTRLP